VGNGVRISYGIPYSNYRNKICPENGGGGLLAVSVARVEADDEKMVNMRDQGRKR
jgi:hypothetical protein